MNVTTDTRHLALEYTLGALSSVMRFKNTPFMPAALRETTAEHVRRMTDQNKARAYRTLPEPFSHVVAENADIEVKVHDGGEIFGEFCDYYNETDPVFQKEMAQRGYAECEFKIAEFGAELALITAARHGEDVFTEIVHAGRKLIPVEADQRRLTPQETIHTVEKLDAFFTEMRKKRLKPMTKGIEGYIESELAFWMNHYADIEKSRTVLGACLKMDEKRDGTDLQARRTKDLDGSNGLPLVGNMNSLTYFNQSARYELLIGKIVAMTEQEPHMAPFVLDAIKAVYETEIMRAGTRLFCDTAAPVDEAGHTATAEALDENRFRLARAYKGNELGKQKPNPVLMGHDVAAEYRWAAEHLARGEVVVPFIRERGRDRPSNLIQRNGYRIVTLAA